MPGSVLAGLALDTTLTGGGARFLPSDQSAAVSIAANATSSGAITTLSGASTVLFQPTGTWVGTLQFQAQADGGTWLNITSNAAVLNLVTGQYVTGGNITANGLYQIALAGAAGVRVITTAYTSGTIGGIVRASAAAPDAMQGVNVSPAGALSTQVVDSTALVSIAANATPSGQITGLSQAATATIQLTGTWTATNQIQVQRDGSTWVNITSSNSIVNVATGAYVASGNLTANGIYQVDVAGCQGVRVITTAYTSGTVGGVVGVSASPSLVSIDGTPAVTVSSGTITTVSTVTTVTTCSTVTTVASVTSCNLGIPNIVTDVTSAAITTTSTSATFTPASGVSHVITIPVTATSGTGQTMDISVNESDDSGTNWRTVYQFPRITGTGYYRSPKLMFSGNRVQYVQTINGTSPSFTRAINRLQCSDAVRPYRQIIDRTIVLTTLSSTTPSLDVSGIQGGLVLTVNIGTATTPPTLQLQGSDDNGGSWYLIGTALAAVASSTVSLTVPNVSPQLARAIVTSAGNTVVAGYVLVRGY